MCLKDGYICIECGDKVPMLYKQYSPTVLKLYHCDRCSKMADKYIEYDIAVVLMDAVLQRVEAFRHLLYNSEYKAFWKLGVFSLVCDAFIKWIHCTSLVDNNQSQLHNDLENGWIFYVMCLRSLLEFTTYVLVILVFTRLMTPTSPAISTTNTRDLCNGLLLANFGQLFAIPAVVWGQSKSQVYLWLTFLFIFITNVQVYRAVRTTVGRKVAWSIILIGFLIRQLVSNWLFQLLDEKFMFYVVMRL